MTPEEYNLFKRIEKLVQRSDAKSMAKFEEKLQQYRAEQNRMRSEIVRTTFYR